MSPSSRKHLLLLCGLSFVLYLPSLFGDFVFDDHYLLEQNTTLHAADGIRQAFTEDYYGQANPRYALGYYRPLALLTHWLDWQIWGNRPFGHHLTNLLLHTGVVAILYLLLSALFASEPLALLAAAIFSAHPSHASTVTFISGRVDALATLLALLALFVFIRMKSVAAIPYFGALLSKEISVTLPALAFWKEYEDRGLPAAFKAMIPFGIALAAAIAIRAVTIGPPRSGLLAISMQGLQNALYAIPAYLRFLVLPPFALYLEPAPGQMPLLWSLLATAIFAAGVYLLKDRRIANWSLVWLFTLVPVLGLVQLETLLDERFLYFPSVSFCLLAAAWLLRYLRSRISGAEPSEKNLLVATALIALLYAPLVLVRQVYWLHDVTLWNAAAKTAPVSAQVRLRLGVALMQAGELSDAEQEFTLALSLPAENSMISAALYTHLATVRQMQGSDKDVEALYRKSLSIDPHYYTAHFNLGLYYKKAGRIDEAIQHFQEAVKSNPKSAPARQNLDSILKQQKSNHP